MNPRLLPLALSLLAAAPFAPTSAQDPADATPPDEETIVSLPVFEVSVDARDSYDALNTISVTGTNRSIRSLPISMEAFTRTFVDDVAASSLNELLTYAVNLDDTTDSTNGGLGDGSQVRIRGLLSKEENRRNGFLALTYQDAFSLDRAEILRGPQSLLYGQGNSAATVNTMTKRARAGDFREAQLKIDDNGTVRASFDLNLERGSLGLRVAGVLDRTEYWQDNLSKDVDGIYAAVSYEFGPKLRMHADVEKLRLDSINRRTRITVRDNSNTDPRRNLILDQLVLDGTTDGIVVGGKEVSWENYWSLMGEAVGRRADDLNYSLNLEYYPTQNLSFRLGFNSQESDGYSNLNFAQEILLRTDRRAINGETSIRVAPGRQSSVWDIDTWQAAGVYQFKLGDFVQNQIVLGGEYRDRTQTFNTMDPYLVDADGEFVPGTGFNGRTALPEFVLSVENVYPRDILPANARFANRAIVGAVAPAEGNPLGIGGPLGAIFIRTEEQTAGYLNWLADWMERRVQTMAGMRHDSVKVDNAHLLTNLYDVSETTWLAGAVVNLTPDLGLYGNYSTSFAAASALRTNPANETLPPGSGDGFEVGLKFDLFSRRMSGSLAYYETSANNENQSIGTAQDVVDAQGINGRNGGPFVDTATISDGVELTLTMRPVKSWRVQLGFGVTDGRFGEDRYLPIYYNDQFHTDGTFVKVGSNAGANLLVPVNPAQPAGATAPLTIAMLKDPASPYFAVLDPASGRITNAAAIRLTSAGVGTGETGLPISDHQLGFVPPSEEVLVFAAGDRTLNYAEKSLTLNTDYRFATGLLKGFSVGGAYRMRRDVRVGYATIDGARQLYFDPDLDVVDLRFGYTRKIRELEWSTQVILQNVTDDLPIAKRLNANGTFNSAFPVGAPRALVWTNTLRF